MRLFSHNIVNVNYVDLPVHPFLLFYTTPNCFSFWCNQILLFLQGKKPQLATESSRIPTPNHKSPCTFQATQLSFKTEKNKHKVISPEQTWRTQVLERILTIYKVICPLIQRSHKLRTSTKESPPSYKRDTSQILQSTHPTLRYMSIFQGKS